MITDIRKETWRIIHDDDVVNDHDVVVDDDTNIILIQTNR